MFIYRYWVIMDYRKKLSDSFGKMRSLLHKISNIAFALVYALVKKGHNSVKKL